jgi:glutamate-5-semialdehyde dehydrogenase
VHQSLLKTIWPVVARALFEADVHLLCDQPTLSELEHHSDLAPYIQSHVKPADESAYTTEHLSLTMGVVTVPSLKEAMEWINSHSSHHTDSIVTESEQAASVFCRGVDSAGTFVNASTRFADGFRYGFGTEVGISTGRIHARGPVGLEGLVIYKYMLRSKAASGHTASEFGTGKKSFKHKAIEVKTVPF